MFLFPISFVYTLKSSFIYPFQGKKDLMAVDNDEDDNIHANDIENEDRVVEASDDSEDSGLDSDEERQRSGR